MEHQRLATQQGLRRRRGARFRATRNVHCHARGHRHGRDSAKRHAHGDGRRPGRVLGRQNGLRQRDRKLHGLPQRGHEKPPHLRRFQRGDGRPRCGRLPPHPVSARRGIRLESRLQNPEQGEGRGDDRRLRNGSEAQHSNPCLEHRGGDHPAGFVGRCRDLGRVEVRRPRDHLRGSEKRRSRNRDQLPVRRRPDPQDGHRPHGHRDQHSAGPVGIQHPARELRRRRHQFVAATPEPR